MQHYSPSRMRKVSTCDNHILLHSRHAVLVFRSDGPKFYRLNEPVSLQYFLQLPVVGSGELSDCIQGIVASGELTTECAPYFYTPSKQAL